MYSVQCVVGSIQVQFQVHLQVQVQCVVYTVQCAVCSVLPTAGEDKTNKKTKQKNSPSVYFQDSLRLYVLENIK